MTDQSTEGLPPTLEELIARAQAAAESMSTNKRNKALIKDMAIALVALAKLNAEMCHMIAAEDARIIIP